jgi:hypothetical protein
MMSPDIHKMKAKRIIFYISIYAAYMMVTSLSLGVNSKTSEAETKDYKDKMTIINKMNGSLSSGKNVKLEDYEKYADDILKKWSQRNKEYNARIILEICGPLGSGQFKDDRQHDLARKYALSVLEEPNEIPVLVEIILSGYVQTLTQLPKPPKGEDYAQRRKKDVEIHLHAWKRLIDSIDPNWDPNEITYINMPVPTGVTGWSGMSPEAIKDTKLRAEYEAAIEKYRHDIERDTNQRRLHTWLRIYPKIAEDYITNAYSQEPYNLAELRQYFEKYKMIDEKIRNRILDTVQKNIDALNKAKSADPNK